MELREIARVVTAVSLAVLAVCAVVVTARVLAGGLPLAVAQQKTFDRADLEQGVGQVLSDRGQRGGFSTLACPANVTIKEGVAFTCRLTLNDKPLKVLVTVTDTDSGTYAVGDPHA